MELSTNTWKVVCQGIPSKVEKEGKGVWGLLQGKYTRSILSEASENAPLQDMRLANISFDCD